MKFKLKIKEKEYDVEILEEKEGNLKIKIGGKDFLFRKNEKKERIPIAKTSLPKRNFSKKEIKAPISGTISEIFVRKGDFVKKGEKLVFLSAMKMENEIISDLEGRVKEILIKKEQKVKEGEKLIILE